MLIITFKLKNEYKLSTKLVRVFRNLYNKKLRLSTIKEKLTKGRIELDLNIHKNPEKIRLMHELLFMLKQMNTTNLKTIDTDYIITDLEEICRIEQQALIDFHPLESYKIVDDIHIYHKKTLAYVLIDCEVTYDFIKRKLQEL